MHANISGLLVPPPAPPVLGQTLLVAFKDHEAEDDQIDTELAKAVVAPRHEDRFEPIWEPVTQQLKDDIAEIINRLENYETFFELRKRKRRAKDKAQFNKIVSWLICAMVEMELRQPGTWMTVSLSHRNYKRDSIYRPSLGKTLPGVLKLLKAEEMGFAEVDKGHLAQFDKSGKLAVPGAITRVRAGGLLKRWIERRPYTQNDLEAGQTTQTVILKRAKVGFWDKGQWMEYRDTPQTMAFRQQMSGINRWLAHSKIEYLGPEQVATNRRLLRRHFVNGSFGQGGRLFGGFWQDLTKEQRQENLRIDGEAIADLDYGQMQPTILYSKLGIRPPLHDAYTLPGMPVEWRDGIKQVLNAALCSSKLLKKFPRDTRGQFPKTIRFAEVMDAIQRAHPTLIDHFFKGEGLMLQNEESNILVRALEALMAADITSLPMHDGVMVPYSKRLRAKHIMEQVFTWHIGKQIEVKLKYPVEG